MKGSIVIPIFNEEVFIETFFKNIYNNLISVGNFEFIFVDDGSGDYSLRILKKLASTHSNIKIISLNKNYGKQVAIAAGMKEATGDFVIVTAINPYNSYLAMNEAIKKWQEGFKIVRAIRSDRKEKGIFTRIKDLALDCLLKFYRIDKKILQKATVELYDRDVVDVLCSLEEKNMLLRSFDSWIDYSIYSFKYHPGSVSLIKGEEYAKLEKGYNELRKKNKEKKSKTIKTRLYGPSLYASLTCLTVFAMSVVLLALFTGKAEIPITFKLFLWLLSITTLISCLLLGSRAWMIKRIGVVPFIKRNDSLYQIKEKYITR